MELVQKLLQQISKSDDKEFSLLKSVLQSLPVCTFVVGIPSRSILWCSSRVQGVFGYEPGELIGESTSVLHVDEAEYRKFDERTRPVVSAGHPYRGLFWMRHRNGDIFPSEHLVTPLHGTQDAGLVTSFIWPFSGGGPGTKADSLTHRERDVFELTIRGLSTKEIAKELGLSPRTVDNHRARILKKFQVETVPKLMSSLLQFARSHDFPPGPLPN